jgi:indole-3-glycerol phosphate synthase
MLDFLDKLAKDAKETVESGYYEDAYHEDIRLNTASCIALKAAILKSAQAAVITEIKAASPSRGTIRTGFNVGEIAQAMARGGAVGISVLTEPKSFQGSLRTLVETRKAVKLPLLMKDIVVSRRQLVAASNIGADAVLLIQSLFNRGYGECGIAEMIAEAHARNLEVLLETHNATEFRLSLDSEADLIGINNRNLGTLKVDLNTTKNILEANAAGGMVVVSESGIESAADIRFLRECGADAFLAGSAVMLADDVEAKVRELVTATVKSNEIITNVKSVEKRKN